MHKGRLITALAAGACVLGVAGAACAENWVAFYIIPAGVVFLDQDSVTRRPGFVSARLESTFPEPQNLKRNGQIFTYVKTIDRVELDCKARVYRNVTRDLYTDTGLMQLSLHDEDDLVPVVTKSAQGALVKAFCS